MDICSHFDFISGSWHSWNLSFDAQEKKDTLVSPACLSACCMLFHFDIINDKINILQIPRDSFVPDFTNSETGKINSVYTLGDENLIPIQRVVDAVRDTFGIPIDRYITTGCDDIVDMVDIIGGIPINLPEQVIYSYDKVLYPGEQVLNGEQAELFVRARKGYNEGDIGRVKAQRIFLAAAMEKALDLGPIQLTKFLTEVYNKGYIGTDLTLQEMSILSDFGSSIDLDDVTVHMVPGEATYYGDYSVWSIHKNATIDVINEYFRPYQPELSYDSLSITELIESDYYNTDIYDENQDTLQETYKELIQTVLQQKSKRSTKSLTILTTLKVFSKDLCFPVQDGATHILSAILMSRTEQE